MTDTAISRRGFLKGSGAVLMGTLAATSGAIAVLAPSRSWALELKGLDAREGKTLLRFTRHLYPHETLDDAVYALVVKALDTAASEPQVQQLLSNGVEDLHEAAGGNWLALSEAEQLEYVKAIEGTPFFEKVRGTAIVSLYNNDMAFAHFGYPGAEGSAGYLQRGFSDLDWLPEPPAAASGPMPGA